MERKTEFVLRERAFGLTILRQKILKQVDYCSTCFCEIRLLKKNVSTTMYIIARKEKKAAPVLLGCEGSKLTSTRSISVGGFVASQAAIVVVKDKDGKPEICLQLIGQHQADGPWVTSASGASRCGSTQRRKTPAFVIRRKRVDLTSTISIFCTVCRYSCV